jgi:hypothetical protein
LCLFFTCLCDDVPSADTNFIFEKVPWKVFNGQPDWSFASRPSTFVRKWPSANVERLVSGVSFSQAFAIMIHQLTPLFFSKKCLGRSSMGSPTGHLHRSQRFLHGNVRRPMLSASFQVSLFHKPLPPRSVLCHKFYFRKSALEGLQWGARLVVSTAANDFCAKMAVSQC